MNIYTSISDYSSLALINSDNAFIIISSLFANIPLGKITFQKRPEDVPENRSDVLRTLPYGAICNVKGCIPSRTTLGRTEDVNLTIIHKMDFIYFFSVFADSNCIADNALQK